MESKNYKVLSVRYIILLVGLCLMSLGIALSIKANLGTTPISCIPYVLSVKFSYLTVGEFTILFNFIFIVLQIILGKSFKINHIIQVVLICIFGYIIDFFLMLLAALTLTTYIGAWIICLLGTFSLALGVFLMIKTEISYMPVDGFVFVVSTLKNYELSNIKIINDISMVIIAAVLSLCFFGQLIGVREGTVVSAFLIGYTIKVYGKTLGSKIDKIINNV